MHITLLGTGASGGVPFIGCKCPVCHSDNPKNKRTRASIVIKHQDTTILVDTSPDLRAQALRENLTHIDAIIFTHAHADHLHGIDEVRSFNYLGNRIIPAYGNKTTMEEITNRFGYAFSDTISPYGWFKPHISPHVVEAGDSITIKDITVETILQHHGKVEVLGLRMGNIAYCTDVKYFPDSSLEQLKGVHTLIIDCLKKTPAPTHADLSLVMEWVDSIKPARTILTHMSHEMDYDALIQELPKGIEPSYDGMVVEA